MTGDDFTVPDDLTELLGPAEPTEQLVSRPAAPTLVPPVPPLGPPDFTGAAGASSRAQLAIGRTLFGRRLTPEQRALQRQARAEEDVGEVLDRLVRVGSRVLHDRRTPSGYTQLDHILISPAGIHLIEALPVSVKTPLTVVDGVPQVDAVPLSQRLKHLHALSRDVGTAAAAIMPRGGLLVKFFAMTAVVGGGLGRGFTSYDVDVVSLNAVPSWVASKPAMYDPVAVAALTDAVARSCPPYHLDR